MKQYRASQFEPAPEKCPDCKIKVKYEKVFAASLIAYDMQKRYNVKIKRRHIKEVGKCKCKEGWVKLDRFDSE